jgi:hypothetical protein
MERREGHTGFWLGGLREGGHLEDTGKDERIILKLILENGLVMHGLDLAAQDSDSWRAFVNTVMNLRVS